MSLRMIRRLVARLLLERPPLDKLGSVGNGCRIHPRAEFAGHLAGIKLADRVSIGREATLHCYDSASYLSVGEGTVIKQFATLMTYPGGYISLGKNCSVNPFCVLYGHGGLEIGDHVRIATHCVVVPAEHRFDDASVPITEQGLSTRGVKIDSDVWIGAGTIILDGCEIGEGCVIGAGSIVTKSLRPYSVAVGAPAREVRKRCANAQMEGTK